MFATFMITLREGIEAFLIVAITLAYIRKTGALGLFRRSMGRQPSRLRSPSAPRNCSGSRQKPLWEGILASVAALMVLSMVIYMMRWRGALRSDNRRQGGPCGREGRLCRSRRRIRLRGFDDYREGMETALILTSLAFSVGSGDMFVGRPHWHIMRGPACLGLVALRTSHQSRPLLPSDLAVPGLFVIQLFIYSFHEFTEGNVLPIINNVYWHVLSEPYGPERSIWTDAHVLHGDLAGRLLLYSWLKERLASAPLPQGKS